jgi:hypothetical protein
LKCRNFLLHNHLEATDSKLSILQSKTFSTIDQIYLATIQSNIRCWTVSSSLHISHSRGFTMPLCLRLSLVMILFWENNHKNTWILGGISVSTQKAGKWVESL